MRYALDGIRALSRTAHARLATLAFLLVFAAVGNAWSAAPTVRIDDSAAADEAPAAIKAGIIEDIIDWFDGDDDDDGDGDDDGSGGAGSDGDW